MISRLFAAGSITILILLGYYAKSSGDALLSVKGVGAKTASDMMASARAITENRLVKKDGKVNMPVRSTEVFFDLEGYAGPEVSGDYLIGALVRKGGSGGDLDAV